MCTVRVTVVYEISEMIEFPPAPRVHLFHDFELVVTGTYMHVYDPWPQGRPLGTTVTVGGWV